MYGRNPNDGRPYRIISNLEQVEPGYGFFWKKSVTIEVLDRHTIEYQIKDGRIVMDQGVSSSGKQNQDCERALENIFKRAWTSDEKRDLDFLPTLRLCYLVEDYSELNEG